MGKVGNRKRVKWETRKCEMRNVGNKRQKWEIKRMEIVRNEELRNVRNQKKRETWEM